MKSGSVPGASPAGVTASSRLPWAGLPKKPRPPPLWRDLNGSDMYRLISSIEVGNGWTSQSTMPTLWRRERATSSAAWTMLRTLLGGLDGDCIQTRSGQEGESAAVEPAGELVDLTRAEREGVEASLGAEGDPAGVGRPGWLD